MAVARIGPYKVVRQLGAGGMGRVYLATSASGREVAVKVVWPELAGDPGFRRRFNAEVQAAKAVSGAFTAPVVDADPDGPLPWLATAYVPGPSLQTAIETYGPMPELSLRVLGAGLAEALVAIHRAGIVHRDLKPSNILLAADGPRVIDFGISKAADGPSLTGEGQVIGSAGYMSPEHAAGLAPGPASDVFSLGAVLAFAATGTSPYGTGPFHVLMYRVKHEPPQLDEIPPGLVGIVAACLHRDPAQRPSAEALPGLLDPGPIAPGWMPSLVESHLEEYEPTLVAPAPTRRKLLLNGGAVAATAAVAGGVALLLRSGPRLPPAPQAVWTVSLPQPDLSPKACSAATVVCSGQGGAASFDLPTGKALWSDAAGKDAGDLSDGTYIYAVRSDQRIHALDARTGAELWASKAMGSSPPQIQRMTPAELLVTDDSGRLYGIGTAHGDSRWTYSTGQKFSTVDVTAAGQVISSVLNASVTNYLYDYHVLSAGTFRWSKSLVALYAPPTGNVLYGIDDAMNLLALQAATGQQLWSGPSGLAPYFQSGRIYVGSLQLAQGTLVCSPNSDVQGQGSGGGIVSVFDASNGRRLWTSSTRAGSGFGVSGQTLCYLDQTLHAVDLRTGKSRWTAGAELGSLQWLGTAGGLFLAAALDNSHGRGGLYGWDAKTGHQVWHHPFATIGGSASWSILRPPGRLLATYSGELLAFRLPGSA